MQRAPRLCSCGLKIAQGGLCPCERRRASARKDARPSASARGYDREWRRLTAGFLTAHPYCSDCSEKGLTTPATVVGHVVSVWKDPSRRLDPTNWKPLCRGCNARDAHREKKGEGGAKAFAKTFETTGFPSTRNNPEFFSPVDEYPEGW
jgi:5-methylcytosine-specific restriction endonuclease McrA